MTTPTDPSENPYRYDGTLVRTVDGDTVVLKLTRVFTVELDLGFHVKTALVHTAAFEQTFRLLGIDTPEVVGETKVAGLAAKAALDKLLQGRALRVTSFKSDKYGRFLCDIVVDAGAEGSINAAEYMLANGFAKPYDGRGART